MNPIWKESFQFYPTQPDTVLRFIVKDYDEYGSDEVAGVLELRLQSRALLTQRPIDREYRLKGRDYYQPERTQ